MTSSPKRPWFRFRTAILTMVVAAGLLGLNMAFWYLRIKPLTSFKNRFSAPVVAVEIKSNKLNVRPYQMIERASFEMGRTYSLRKPSNRSNTVIFYLANGEHVDCLFDGSIEGNFLFTPVDGEMYGPHGIETDLLPKQDNQLPEQK